MKFEGSFTAKGQVSTVVSLNPKEVLAYAITTSELTGSVILEKATKGLQGWEPVVALSATGSGTLRNDDSELMRVRLRVEAIDEVEEESVAYKLEQVTGQLVEILVQDAKLRPVFSLDDQDQVIVHKPVVVVGLLNTSEVVYTNDSAAVAVNLEVYKTEVVSSGSEGGEDLEIGDAGIIGQRKLIVFKTRTHASDKIVLDHANFSQGSDTIGAIELDAANEFILAEFRGVKWEILAASVGVVSVI
jgi:hypothetical protein